MVFRKMKICLPILSFIQLIGVTNVINEIFPRLTINPIVLSDHPNTSSAESVIGPQVFHVIDCGGQINFEIEIGNRKRHS